MLKVCISSSFFFIFEIPTYSRHVTFEHFQNWKIYFCEKYLSVKKGITRDNIKIE